MHMGTSLKTICDELAHLIIKGSTGYISKTKAEECAKMKHIKYFKQLVSCRWNTELASIANKDLMEKRWNKPLLLLLVADVQMFRDGVMRIPTECTNTLLDDSIKDLNAYKLLVQCTLSLLIIFNRRRIGDVQYLKIKDYNKDMRSNYDDFESALTETEKILTRKYKRVVNCGKGSRAVVILIPNLIESYMDVLLAQRPNYITDPENEYVFATPGSKIKWGKGDVALRNLCKKLKIENAQCITSNKLGKQIATIMQIMNLTRDEVKQFASFMGHTEKTHSEFYELPVDVYQTAKVSKILLMMEKGKVPVEYKGKSLADIDIDPNTVYAEIDNDVEINSAAQENAPSDRNNASTDEAQIEESDEPVDEILGENNTFECDKTGKDIDKHGTVNSSEERDAGDEFDKNSAADGVEETEGIQELEREAQAVRKRQYELVQK